MSVLEFIVIALGATIVAVVAFWCLSPDFRRRIEVPKYRFRSRQQIMDGNGDSGAEQQLLDKHEYRDPDHRDREHDLQRTAGQITRQHAAAEHTEYAAGMDSLSGEALATINLIVDAGKLETPDTQGIY